MTLRLIRLLLLFSLISVAGGRPLAAQPTPELEIKAAFLFNFIRFIDWPKEVFAGPQEPWVIGVLGQEDPFENQLEAAVRGKTVDGRPLEVRFGQSASELRGAHVVYISHSARESEADVLAHFSGLPVVTVGETPAFTAAGGVVRFFRRERKVAFEINPAAAEEGGLRISSRLLSVAHIYREPTGASQ